MEYLFYFFIGSLAGSLSGLFGIGGGIIVVPGLALLFAQLQIGNGHVMHMAAGTSLAIMIVTSASSATSHYRLKTLRWPLVYALLPGILFGVIVGALATDFLHTTTLTFILGIFLLLMSVTMLLSSFMLQAVEGAFPPKLIMFGIASVIGCVSGMLGIGSGSLSVPFLSHYRVSMKNVAGVSALCTLPVALVGTLMFIITGWNENLPAPYTTGYIYWPAFGLVATTSLLFAPLGATLSSRCSTLLLKRIFSIVLFIIACHLLLQR